MHTIYVCHVIRALEYIIPLTTIIAINPHYQIKYVYVCIYTYTCVYIMYIYTSTVYIDHLLRLFCISKYTYTSLTVSLNVLL